MNILLLTFALLSGIQPQPSTRKLLLFSGDQAAYLQQLKILSTDSAGMNERDLVLITIENHADYRKHNVTPGTFALLLIGKDGGEKLRSTKPVSVETIFGLIDSMPMRKQEMKRNER